MENDEYFYQIIYVDTFLNNYFYNTSRQQIHAAFYHISYLLCFIRQLSCSIRDVFSRPYATSLPSRYESRAEMALTSS